MSSTDSNAAPNPAAAAIAATSIGSLAGKIALITGGSSGFGRAIAQAYAAAGAFVVSADITPDPPHAPLYAKEASGIDHITPTVDWINSHFPAPSGKPPRASFVHTDMTSAHSVEAAVAFTASTYGRLDVMVNNAGLLAEGGALKPGSGITLETRPRLHDMDEEVLDKTYALNIKGVFLGMKYAVAQMLAQTPASVHPSGDRGWIVNMGSIAGMIGLQNSPIYCASKGAVHQMTRVAAIDYAKDRIHVNAIAPGFAQTPFLEPVRTHLPDLMAGAAMMHPWGRLALTDDVAKMAVFLAGDGASFCTGSIYVVDGGYTAQ